MKLKFYRHKIVPNFWSYCLPVHLTKLLRPYGYRLEIVLLIQIILRKTSLLCSTRINSSSTAIFLMLLAYSFLYGFSQGTSKFLRMQCTCSFLSRCDNGIYISLERLIWLIAVCLRGWINLESEITVQVFLIQ